MRELRYFFGILLAGIILFAGSAGANACEIDFKILKGEKKAYSKGDVLIVKVEVFLTHRNCPEGIQATKFELKGLEVAAATNWDEQIALTYVRKLKIKITGSGGEAMIKAVRKCDKEGGLGTMKLKLK